MAASASPISSAIPKSRSRLTRWRSAASAKVWPRPDRISISVSISSPLTAEASSSSRRQAACISSKRCSRSRTAGSTIANSSSIPIVKSAEASKISRTASRSSPSWFGSGSVVTATPGLGQIEVEGVEEVDRRARGVNGHIRRHLQEALGVVEDDLHPGLHQPVGDLLRGVGGDGQNAHHHLLSLHDRVDLVEGAHL